jgi:uncharacterized protein (DUF2141 family)
MKPVYKAIMLMSACAASTLAINASNASQKKDVSLNILVDGIRSDSGDVSVTLCVADETFPSGCTISAKSIAKKGQTTVSFSGLKDGIYAAALFHDENADGQLTFIQEGLAFSNNSNLDFGPPKFEPAKFSVNGDTVIHIDMRYFN